MSRFLKTTTCLAAMLAVSACASSHDQPKPTRLCPQVAIVRDLERVTDYGTAAPSAPDLVSVALMKSVEGGCEYTDDEKKAGADVRFTLHMGAKKGPRLKGDKVSYPFFVSLVGPDGAILKKDLMTASFEFGSGDKFAMHDEKLHVFIPGEKDVSVEGYRILMGFQLTEDQLNAARAERQK